ncbi:Amino acid transporter AVT6C [Glycine max]|nr:Amino acid transporter AVT6C [Glycine max]
MKLEESVSNSNITAPLLPPEDPSPSPQNGSISGAVFNITTTMIGAGIMSIPATMKVLGIVPGLVVIVLVALITDVTVEFMLRYTSSGKSSTYAGMMAESFGSIGSLAVKICVIITNLGVLIIYFIILGDVLCGNESNGITHLGILQEWFGINWLTSRAFALLFVALFIMLPLVMLRRVDSLRYSSAISILLALVFVVICSSMAVSALLSGKSQTPRIVPDFSQVTVLDLFTTIPVFVTGFGFHVNVHPIRAELIKVEHMGLAARISLIICVAIYFAIGFFGYLLFGDSIMPDVLVNFDQNSHTSTGRLLNAIVRLSYALHLALVFPIMNYSLRANIDELIFSNKNKPPLASDTPRFVSLTLTLLALTYLVAVAIPNIWYFFQFLGSTTIVSTSFIFPAAIVLSRRSQHHESEFYMPQQSTNIHPTQGSQLATVPTDRIKPNSRIQQRFINWGLVGVPRARQDLVGVPWACRGLVGARRSCQGLAGACPAEEVLCGNESKGTTHSGVLQEWFGINWWTSRAFALLIVARFIMFPLVMLRRVDSLRYSSAISILLALVFITICSSMAFSALIFSPPSQCLSRVLDSTSMVCFKIISLPA